MQHKKTIKAEHNKCNTNADTDDHSHFTKLSIVLMIIAVVTILATCKGRAIRSGGLTGLRAGRSDARAIVQARWPFNVKGVGV